MIEEPLIPTDAIRDVMEKSDHGDKRLDDRNGKIAEMIASMPQAEFPQAASDEAETEATYRFWRHADTAFEPVVEPHLEETARRIETEDQPVLVVHDTTAFEFGERFRPGLGPVEGDNRYGFYGHFSLAVRRKGPRLPIGLVGGQLWRRQIPSEVEAARREPSKDCLEVLEDEEAKWEQGIEETQGRLEEEAVIHVMDRGADSYPRIARLAQSPSERFVLRAAQNRRVCEEIDGVERPKLEDALEEAPILAEKSIQLSSRDQSGRPPSARKHHPSREAREANVEIRGRTVEIRRPHDRSGELPEAVELGVVWVHEPDPPEGAEPVDWRLYTSEPTESAADVNRVVESYDRRWVIEQYYGVLKGVCRIEERNLESAQTLTTALGMMVVASWRLLALRTMAQNRPTSPADKWLRRSQREVLVADSKTDLDEIDPMTVGEALEAIASMGGHLTQNGKPGWLVITRGYNRLRLKELAWRKAERQGREAERRSTLEQVRSLASDAQDLEAFVEELAQVPESSDNDL